MKKIIKSKTHCNRAKNAVNWKLISHILLGGVIFFVLDILLFAVFYWNTECICKSEKLIFSFPEMLYFSLITFTTTGYGDLLPTCHFAKLFVGIQSLTSYLFTPIYTGYIFKAVIERPKNVKFLNSKIALTSNQNSIALENHGKPLKNNKIILQILDENGKVKLNLTKETDILDDYWELYFFEIDDEIKRCRVYKKEIFSVKLMYFGNDIETNQLVFVSKALELRDIQQ